MLFICSTQTFHRTITCKLEKISVIRMWKWHQDRFQARWRICLCCGWRSSTELSILCFPCKSSNVLHWTCYGRARDRSGCRVRSKNQTWAYNFEPLVATFEDQFCKMIGTLLAAPKGQRQCWIRENGLIRSAANLNRLRCCTVEYPASKFHRHRSEFESNLKCSL